MADAFDQYQLLVRESVDDSVVDATLSTDDVSWSLLQTFKPISMGGRDTQVAPGNQAQTPGFFAEWRIKVQQGGLVQAGSFSGDTVFTAGAQSHLMTGQIGDIYPDPASVPLPAWIACRLALKRITGSLTMNRKQLFARMMAQTLDDVVSDDVMDIVKLVRHYICSNMWSDGPGSLGRVVTAPGSVAVAARFTTALTEGTPFRFIKGQPYNIGSYIAVGSRGASNSSPRATSGQPAVAATFTCVDIDIFNRTVTFELTTDGVQSGTVTTIAAGDMIFRAKTHNFAAANFNAGIQVNQGFESLLINTGNFPGAFYGTTALDVANHNELAAYVAGNESALVPPTPERIAEPIDYITDSGKPTPDVLVAEQSVWTMYAHLERRAGVNYPVPQGSPFVANGGVDGPNFTHMGKSFAKLSSAMARPGMVLGLSPRTFKKFMPQGPGSVQWAWQNGGLSGQSGIFGPSFNGRSLMEVSQAPYDAFCEVGCEDPRSNYRRIGFQSQRTS